MIDDTVSSTKAETSARRLVEFIFYIRYKRPDIKLTEFIVLLFLVFGRRTHNVNTKFSSRH